MSCPKRKGYELRACDVHRYVDKDAEPRDVRFCGLCKAWICDECAPDMVKRAKAMSIRGAEAFKRGLGMVSN